MLIEGSFFHITKSYFWRCCICETIVFVNRFESIWNRLLKQMKLQNWLCGRRSATNSLQRICGVEGGLMKRTLAVLISPSSQIRYSEMSW